MKVTEYLHDCGNLNCGDRWKWIQIPKKAAWCFLHPSVDMM